MPRTLVGSLGRERGLVLVSLALQIALAVLVARVLGAGRHTLEGNGRWRTTKTELARGLNGAFAYLTGPQALAGGQLDLGAWHGFNEVVYRHPLELRRLEFTFYLGHDACLTALVDRDEEGQSAGVRLSTYRRYPVAFLEIAPDGRFLARSPLVKQQPPGAGVPQRSPIVRNVAKNVVHRAVIDLGPEEVAITIDGQAAGTFPYRSRGRRTFGFRGGLRPALVDDLVATLADGTTIREGFDAPGVTPGGAVIAALAAVATYLVLFVAFRRHRGRPLAFRILLAQLNLVVIALLAHGYVLVRNRWYPVVDATLAAAEAYHLKGATDRVLGEIRRRHPSHPVPPRPRILLVGSSQTWGSGALADDQTFAAVLESLLAGRAGGSPAVEVINAGIPATVAADLAPLLEAEWLALGPQVVAINLSSNDRAASPEKAFAPALRRMVRAARRAGAVPVLVKEANAHGAGDRGLRARHGEMEAIGRDEDVPVIDMHAHLSQFEDEGFLWWDKVHLTPFGQRLLAEKLAADLEPLLARAVGSWPDR